MKLVYHNVEPDVPRSGRPQIAQRVGNLLAPSSTLSFSQIPVVLSDLGIAKVPVDDFNSFHMKLRRRIGGGQGGRPLEMLDNGEVGEPMETQVVVLDNVALAMRRKFERLEFDAIDRCEATG